MILKILIICSFYLTSIRTDHVIDKSQLNDLKDEKISNGILDILHKNQIIKDRRLNDEDIQNLLKMTDFGTMLTNVLVAMDQQSPLSVNLTAECLAAGMRWIGPLLNPSIPWIQKLGLLLASPLGKVIDSWGKPTPRILLGSTNWAGAYDECKAVDGTKYCLSNVVVMNISKLMITNYGSCFPQECTAEDISELFSKLNEYLQGKLVFQPGAMCEEPREYEFGVIITIVIMALILALCLIGTLVESKVTSNKTLPYEVDQGKGDDKDRTKNQEDKGCTLVSFFLAFSLIRNTKAIMATEVKDGSITCINGVRVISLTWVILGHIYAMTVANRIDNVVTLMDDITSFTNEAVINATVSVDSFFLMSGLLVAYLTLKRIDKRGMGVKDILMYYLHRYIRLTPSMALVMLYYTNLVQFTFAGPNLAIERNALQKPCLDYWWSNLLYINNFYPEDLQQECYAVTWYLANDMQFYVVAPFILLLMACVEKRFRSGKLLNFIFILFLCTISIIITGLLIGLNHLPILGFKGDINKQAEVQDKIYVRPYCRITPYLIGMFLGYMFSRKITVHQNNKKITAFIGWIIAAVIALAVIYGPYDQMHKTGIFSDTEHLIYGTFARFAWGLSLAWVIYACHHNIAGFINSLLSWKIWTPLSRLSYGAYLIHIMVIFYLYRAKQEGSNHYQQTILAFDFASITTITFGCSYILTVCVDYPVQNLEKIIFKR